MRSRRIVSAASVGLMIAAIGAAEAAADPRAEPSASLAKQIKKLKKRLAALEAKAAPAGLPPTGPAGGALAGTYPNPSLNVSGGPCANGQALTNVSAQAGLTCAPGIYTDGVFNVAAQSAPFPFKTTGSSNTAIGDSALLALTDGGSNTAVGLGALGSNNSGNEGTALGAGALNANSTGFRNTAVGRNALASNTTAGNNVAVGGGALTDNQSGAGNTALGQGALDDSTGAGNTAVGLNAGTDLTTGSNNIAIGNPGVAGESNTTRIGSAQTRTFLSGVAGTTVTGGLTVEADTNGQLGVAGPSSRTVKRDIHRLGALPELMKLRPVSFRYRTGAPELHYGLIAEQVVKALPTLAVSGPDGPVGVQYQELPVLLLAELQDQQRRFRALRAENRRQQAQIDWLVRHAGGKVAQE